MTDTQVDKQDDFETIIFNNVDSIVSKLKKNSSLIKLTADKHQLYVGRDGEGHFVLYSQDPDNNLNPAPDAVIKLNPDGGYQIKTPDEKRIYEVDKEGNTTHTYKQNDITIIRRTDKSSGLATQEEYNKDGELSGVQELAPIEKGGPGMQVVRTYTGDEKIQEQIHTRGLAKLKPQTITADYLSDSLKQQIEKEHLFHEAAINEVYFEGRLNDGGVSEKLQKYLKEHPDEQEAYEQRIREVAQEMCAYCDEQKEQKPGEEKLWEQYKTNITKKYLQDPTEQSNEQSSSKTDGKEKATAEKNLSQQESDNNPILKLLDLLAQLLSNPASSTRVLEALSTAVVQQAPQTPQTEASVTKEVGR